MQLFHELVAEDWIPDTDPRWSKRHWNVAMGCLEVLRIVVVADRVSGTADFNMVFLESPDLTGATLNVASSPFTSAPLSAGQSNILTASLSPSSQPSSYSYAFQYWLHGASARAHVRIWVTGRGRL